MLKKYRKNTHEMSKISNNKQKIRIIHRIIHISRNSKESAYEEKSGWCEKKWHGAHKKDENRWGLRDIDKNSYYDSLTTKRSHKGLWICSLIKNNKTKQQVTKSVCAKINWIYISLFFEILHINAHSYLSHPDPDWKILSNYSLVNLHTRLPYIVQPKLLIKHCSVICS